MNERPSPLRATVACICGRYLSHHALLIVRLQIADHLRNQRGKLPADVGQILRHELTLRLAPLLRAAECRLELRHAVLLARRTELRWLLERWLLERRRERVLRGERVLRSEMLAQMALAHTADAGVHGELLRRLALQRAHDLRQQRQ